MPRQERALSKTPNPAGTAKDGGRKASDDTSERRRSSVASPQYHRANPSGSRRSAGSRAEKPRFQRPFSSYAETDAEHSTLEDELKTPRCEISHRSASVDPRQRRGSANSWKDAPSSAGTYRPRAEYFDLAAHPAPARDTPGEAPPSWRESPSHRGPAGRSETDLTTAGMHYLQYPDQTLQALQSPSQTASPRPRSRMPRSRDSSSALKTAREGDAAAAIRAAAVTPAQSPGLYTPPFSPTSQAADSDEGRHSALHAAHMTEPKETHKLNKDFDPATGRKFLNNYELIDKIGSGQHGTVKLGRNFDTGQFVAVKIVRRFSKRVRLGKAGNPNDTIKKEVAILKKARHPHVVSLFEVIDDEQYEKVYLVLEYVERGEIVWRKATDRALARFEMARLERERLHGLDEALENRAIDEFNAGVPQRRLQRESLLAECKREALDRLGPEFVEPLQSRPVSLWSLEYGGESEHEDNTRMSRADLHAAQSRTLDSSPFRITNPFAPHDSDRLMSPPSSKATSVHPSPRPSASVSRDSSRPVTRTNTPSSTRSHNEDRARLEQQLQVMIDRVVAEHDAEHGQRWSPAEEAHRYVPCLTLQQALEAFQDTVLGLEYLHYQGIIHRDIKPANLLWTHDYRVKISDFGVSYLGKPMQEDEEPATDEALELAKTVGTPAFYAPELCDPALFEPGRKGPRPEITGQIDVWALGVTLYGMIYGRLPFFDSNEFVMYEKIAREEVFIPRRRLKGVEHNKRVASHYDKRAEDVLQYQWVDDSLRDLLQRLLQKDPSQRISLSEVKHHPWVVSGIENKEGWLDETDPSRQSEGRKIEVSNQDVQDAVVGITFFERIKTGFTQRMSSVFRGRSTRNRAVSSVKSSGETSTRSDRRASLHGDEQIFTALKASRESALEHPLAQSCAPSPTLGPYDRPMSAIEDSLVHRPLLSERSLTTDESMKTVKASDRLPTKDLPVVETDSSTLASILGGASRRLVRSMRSRDFSWSSRSSSNEQLSDTLHAEPSLGISSALAAGHVDAPLALQEESRRPLSPKSSADSFQQRAVENSRRRRQNLSISSGSPYSPTSGPRGHRRSASSQLDYSSPSSPSPRSRPHQSTVSSSSAEQTMSGSSSRSGPLDILAAREAPDRDSDDGDTPVAVHHRAEREQESPSLRKVSQSGRRGSKAGKSRRSAGTRRKSTRGEEEAGYTGEVEEDSDDGLAMA